MALSILARGTDVITKTGPGVFVSQTIAVPGLAAGDTVVIVPMTSTADAQGTNGLYISSVATDAFVVKSDRPQLARDVTIAVIIATGSS